MTDNVQQAADLVKELRALFDKHAPLFLAAESCLEKQDYEGFKQTYNTASQEALAEMVMAQHLKTNEIYGVMVQRSETLMHILRDISNCKDFIAFDDLRKRARTILLAQDMVDRGKDPEEVMKVVEEQTKGTSTSSIIVQ